MAEDKILASVVVAVKDDQRLHRLVESLATQTSPRESYEVIVVENGSSAFAEVQGANAGTVRYLHTAHANMAAARNMGLAAARGRYILLTDADCVARSNWIESMIDRLADGSVMAAGGAIEKYQPRTWTQRHAITVVDGQLALNYLPALDLPYVAGANAGFVTETLRRVGGFDETLRSGNDVDACYKLGLHGYRIGLAPEAVVMHEDRAGVMEHFRRFKAYAVYQVLLYAKYKHISGKRFIFDDYPFRRGIQALVRGPSSLAWLVRGNPSPLREATLQLIEAAGVLCGEMEGLVRFRQPYL